MSRGLGTTQRGILAELGQAAPQTIATLASALGRSPRQALTAVRALERRGLVTVSRGTTGRRGAGEYGPLARRDPFRRDLPVAHVTRKGEPFPYSRNANWVATRDIEHVRAGMPIPGLWVSLIRADSTCYWPVVR